MGEGGSALVSILDTETHFCIPKWASPQPALRQEPLMCAGLMSSSDIAVTPLPSGEFLVGPCAWESVVSLSSHC